MALIRLSIDVPESSQIPVTAMDPGEKMGQAKAQVPPSLATRAGDPAPLPPSLSDWLSDDHHVFFLLDLVNELDLSAILIAV